MGKCGDYCKGAVVRIQTMGASGEGILTSELFLICNEHLAEILAVFLAYKTLMQEVGLQMVGMV